MRNRSFIAVAGALVALLVLAGAVYAYDQGRSDRIAKGVTVAGIDVGGMSRQEAKAELRRGLLDPLSQPITVRHRKRTFTLSAEQARVGIDLDGSVAAAVQASRDGNLVTRAFRDLTGGEVDREVEVQVAYDRTAVTRLVDRIEAKLERDAVDAHVNLEEGDTTPQPSKDGRRVVARRLTRQIRSALTSPTVPRDLRVRTAVVKPEVTTEDLADKYPTVLVVDRQAFTLRLYKALELKKTYRIAVGKVGMDTPAGLYNIQNKAENPAWHVPDSEWAGDLAGEVIPADDPRNPIEARWMGIFDGAGIHGTTATGSIGTAASHGCVRMLIPDVIELYDQVETGAPVYIA